MIWISAFRFLTQNLNEKQTYHPSKSCSSFKRTEKKNVSKWVNNWALIWKYNNKSPVHISCDCKLEHPNCCRMLHCMVQQTTKKVSVSLIKIVDTIGNCQRPVFSLCVSQHMHKKQTCENLSSIGGQSCEIWMKTKHTCQTKLFAFRVLDFETSSSKSEVSKSNSWKTTSFSETTPLQREPFLTMFHTINLSPLLVSK